MTKFLVTCTKIYNGTMFVDAENNEEALDIAQNKLNENVDCINWDFGEATADIADEEEVILDGDGEEESHLDPNYEPKYNVGEYIIEANYKDMSDKRIVFFKIDDIRNGKYICSDGKEDDLDYLDTDVDLRLATVKEIDDYFKAHHKYNVGDFVGSIDCPPDKVVDISYDAYYFESGETAYILALDNNADFYLIQPKYNVGDYIVSECGTIYKVICAEHGSYIAENKYGDERCHFNNDNGVFNFRLATPEEVNAYNNQSQPKYNVGECVGNVRWGYFTITEIKDGKYIFENGDEEPIATFDANEDNHIETFHREDFQPFDKVLVRDSNCAWFASFFSHITNNDEYPYFICAGLKYEQCVPYNGETSHLIGTTADYNGKYKTW